MRASEAATNSMPTNKYRHEAVFFQIATIQGRLTRSILDCIVAKEHDQSAGTSQKSAKHHRAADPAAPTLPKYSVRYLTSLRIDLIKILTTVLI